MQGFGRVGNLLPTRFLGYLKRRKVGFQPTADTAGVVVGWASQPTVTAEYNITAEYYFNFTAFVELRFRQPEND